MINLRKDELLDRDSYYHKIQAQKYAIRADTFRHDAYGHHIMKPHSIRQQK